VRASLAPSVFNTQPWSLHLRGRQLELRADFRRQLEVLDPSGRQLTISCGAALLNARVSLAADGFGVQVDRFPDFRHRDLVARLTLTGDQRPQIHARVSLQSPAGLVSLDQFVDRRHTNRSTFTSDDVPDEVIAVLGRAATAEQGGFFVVRTPGHRAALRVVGEHARTQLASDPSYRSEIRSWGREDAGHATQAADGGRSDSRCVVVIGSSNDDPVDWLCSGEALERLLLETTRQGFVAGPLVQTIVTAPDRHTLRVELGLAMTPQVVLRIGRAPVSLASRRRRLVDLLVEDV
jgi:hypothetical protein